jgi:hypothetical protein
MRQRDSRMTVRRPRPPDKHGPGAGGALDEIGEIMDDREASADADAIRRRCLLP